jgi:hypothetical protein
MSYFTNDKSISRTASVVCELKHLLTNVLGTNCDDIVNDYISNSLTSICADIELRRQIEKFDRQQSRIMKFYDQVHLMSFDDAQDEHYRVHLDSEDDEDDEDN